MSFYPIQGTVRDKEGNVISGASVTLYEADGSLSTARCYTDKSGALLLSNSTTTTDSDGKFILYIDTTEYAYGYLFDLVMEKENYISKRRADVRG